MVRAGVGADAVAFAGLAVTDLDGLVVDFEFAGSGVADLAAAAFDGADVDLEFADSGVAVLAVMDLVLAVLAVVALGPGLAPLATATGAGALALPRGVDGCRR